MSNSRANIFSLKVAANINLKVDRRSEHPRLVFRDQSVSPYKDTEIQLVLFFVEPLTMDIVFANGTIHQRQFGDFEMRTFHITETEEGRSL